MGDTGKERGAKMVTERETEVVRKKEKGTKKEK